MDKSQNGSASPELLHVAVLMGGQSSEHEVSLNSGRNVLEHLDPARFEGTGIVIGKDGAWRFGDDAEAMDIYAAIAELRTRGIDCVLIALHGTFGEDGRIQGMLDLLGLPYTGSGCASSALAMDKVRSKAVVSLQGIRVAGHLALDRATWAVDSGAVLDAVQKDIGFPCVIKPADQGSSVGVEIPQNLLEFQPALERVLDVADYVMVEEFVQGRELTCSVLDADPTGYIRPLPVTEIRPKTARFFDYEAKYTPGATDEITPAEIPRELAEAIQEMAVHAHEIMGCSGWSRSDFMVDDAGPVWIEINTVPGLTRTSLYPQAAAAAGISYGQMIGKFIDAALRRAERIRERV